MRGACPAARLPCIRGLLKQLELTDDELAAVLGHEIAHALREHVREGMGRQQATAVGTAVGSAVLEYFTGVNPGELGHTFTQAMFVLPNSREKSRRSTASASNSPRGRATTRGRP